MHPATNDARLRLGFLTVEQTIALAQQQVTILDPGSTLISSGVVLTAGIVIWPGVTLQCGGEGRIRIGKKTILLSGTRIVAQAGDIAIGDESEIGDEGGFTIQVFAREHRITIGKGARLLGGGSLAQTNDIGDGAQILGPIRAQDIRLGGGGSHRHPEPDERGGVLKGAGVARKLEVPKGRVIQAFGLFAEAPMHPQSFFHPKS
jgi:carbonic anhydrase/acetyltransferase-like protein (isoleucine patch superfamily)